MTDAFQVVSSSQLGYVANQSFNYENYKKSDKFPGYPPLDMWHRSDDFDEATDMIDGYYICPYCSGADQKEHDYDEAIRCSDCEKFYNTI